MNTATRNIILVSPWFTGGFGNLLSAWALQESCGPDAAIPGRIEDYGHISPAAAKFAADYLRFRPGKKQPASIVVSGNPQAALSRTPVAFIDDDQADIAIFSAWLAGCQISDEAARLIRRATRISCINHESANRCLELGAKGAAIGPDALFLLPSARYQELAHASGIRTPEKYLACYITDPQPQKKAVISRIEKTARIPCIITAPPECEKSVDRRLGLPVMRQIEVPDWLGYLLGATLVITDSFHCICIALVLGRDFIFIGEDERTRELPGDLVLKNRLCSLAGDPAAMRIEAPTCLPDYERIIPELEKMRQAGRDWLGNALAEPKKDICKSVAVSLDAALCTGCGACVCVCPINAVSLRKDAAGFLRRLVNAETCTNCGICSARCPTLHPVYANAQEPACYAAQAPEDIRMASSSGGVFTVAAARILKSGGHVCGVVFTEDFDVKFDFANDIADLARFRGSKYIQANAAPVYPVIRDYLKKGEKVLFTGLPCQVAGLRAYLGEDPEDLVCLDLVCFGVPNHKVFDRYMASCHNGKGISNVKFKDKTPWGWHPGVKLWFEDGSGYERIAEHDPWYRSFLQRLARSSACSNCKFAHTPRQGDITIGDFWRIGEFKKSLDDNKGTSLVLTNNVKGHEFFKDIKDGFALVEEAPLGLARKGNKTLYESFPKHKNSDIFFRNLENLPFATLVSSCIANRVFEQKYLELSRKVPPEEHEFYYLARYAVEYAKGREIVTWVRSAYFERILEKYFQKKVAFGISLRKDAVEPDRVKLLSDIKNQNDKYFIVSIDRSWDEQAERELLNAGFKYGVDCVFRIGKPIILTKFDLTKSNYHDEYGNSVEGFSGIIDSIIFRGFNNHVFLGKDVSGVHFLRFDLAANTFIDLDERCRITAPVHFTAPRHVWRAKMRIGRNCVLEGGILRIFAPGEITIGEGCTFCSGFEIRVNMGKKVVFGRDCMASLNVVVLAGDGHAIFDVTSGECINRCGKSWKAADACVLGDHVWIGNGAFFLANANVGTGSIVGARSLVRSAFPNNCALAGVPAKRVSSNRAWSRDPYAPDVKGIANYACPTRECAPPVSGRKVLVCGGNRSMGLYLTRELIRLGNDVHIANRGLRGDPFGMAVRRITFDAGDAESAKKALAGQYFDVVFDNIAYCSRFTENILSNIKCGKYVQLSSAAVYSSPGANTPENSFNPESLPLLSCGPDADYGTGKRQAEAFVIQKKMELDPVMVRVPFIAPTERLYYYCINTVRQIPMNIDDVSLGLCFAREAAVGVFLPWLGAQNYTGPINFASAGMVTIGMILEYIAKKTGKDPVLDMEKGIGAPFVYGGQRSFYLNLDKCERLGWIPEDLSSWFWKLMDVYIDRAIRNR